MGGYNESDDLEQRVASASKAELTFMLYEGALNFCKTAKELAQEGDFIKAGQFIVKVQNIIREFQQTLDRSYEISRNFDALYDYMYRRLVEASISRDVDILNEICDLLSDFRDMWKELIAAEKAASI